MENKNYKNGTLDHFPYLSKESMEEIDRGFDLLKIETTDQYFGADLYTKLFQKVSVLRYEGIVFTTSANTYTSQK
ncbi:MAG: hypothetical protein V3S16_03565 [Candidatus Desulfatibia sp.]|uniref:hypothetical protein n=1 Tax=Candidatus Desulfatibia sp. TaxID=3101189 RepID=UPI002F31D821